MKILDRVKEYRKVPACDLVPHEKNWRTHPDFQSRALRDLLKEIGFAGAILARKLPDGRLAVIDGHLRIETMGKREVGVLVTDLTAEEAEKVLLTYDPISSMATADQARLEALMASVHTDSPAIAAMLEKFAGEAAWQILNQPQKLVDPPAQIDKAGELQKKWRTKTGQLWQIDMQRLLCGDSTKPEDVERVMDGQRAVLFDTDPPYAVGYTGGSHPQSWRNKGVANRDKNKSGQYFETTSADVENSEASGVELYRGFVSVAIKHAITRNAAWYCWHASRRQMMLESVWNEFGAFVHQQIIWVKSRPVLTYSTYLWQHEPCLFGWIKGEKPKIFRTDVGQRAGEFPTTVWAIPSSEIETDAHPTSKPCKLFALSIEMHTEPGEICYEPFSGSGSQLVAAQQLGRRCYALEKSAPFVAVALERLTMLGLKPQLINS
jgi:DNA modification methylase